MNLERCKMSKIITLWSIAMEDHKTPIVSTYQQMVAGLD